MIYLITKMIAYLIAAGLIGLAFGWILRSIGVEKARKLVEYSYQDKMDALTEQHQEELAEFAEIAKQSRADHTRLETNNKALRETIDNNSTALELAQAEVVQLTAKLKASEAFNKEILEVTGHSVEEFDETMDVREQSLDSSNIEISETTLDESIVGTQDKTLTEAENIGDAEITNSKHEAIDILDASEPVVVKDENKVEEEAVEITMGNLWSHIGKVVGTKK